MKWWQVECTLEGMGTEKLLNGDVSASQPVPALGDSLRATANGITQAFAGLKMGGQTIQTNLAAISNGLSLLLNGDGTQQNPGFAGANAGLNMLANSLAAMQSSLSEALAEAAPLPGGAEQIAEGLNEMKNSTNGIEDQVNAQIDSILDGFSGSFDAPSFADARNKVSSVQFIFMTQAIRITKADDAPADIPEISEPAPKTAWDRLVDLFR
ncbi:MAG: hypothetical protein IJN00_00085 [Clostridia bacterium]|nr:hypothetical protein [Clostridia bacterium]